MELMACDCTTVIVALALAALVVYFTLVRRPKNYPPGPTGVPVVGYIPFLGKNAAETMRKMKPKYGSVMSVRMGGEDWIILNDYDTINEALVKRGESFSGRPNNFFLNQVTGGYGLAMADYGKTWTTLRKFGLMTLRGFGLGKKGMEENVIEETPFLIENLMTKNKLSTNMKLTLAVSNIICRVTFGRRFFYDDKTFTKLLDILLEFFSDSATAKMTGILSLAPALRHIPPFKGALKDIRKDLDEFFDILKGIIEEHEKNYDENDIRDFIDAFLKEMKSRGENDPTFCAKQLLQYIRDMFEAGTGTTSTTLTWAMLCFANYPEYQEKIFKEIETVIGDSGIPTMKHREEMPYTCAFIQELMRHRTLLPLSVFHKTNKESKLRGYTIPKDVTVSPNIWAVHYDPDLFKNPTEFRPERFLDGDGKFIKSNHVIPFSIGPRHCIGEQLARMEVFIFLTGIVQKLKVVPDNSEEVPSFHSGIYTFLAYEPPNFEVNFEKR